MSEQGEFESGMSFNEGYRAGKKEMEELIKRKDEALVLANKRLSDEDFTLMNIALGRRPHPRKRPRGHPGPRGVGGEEGLGFT